jgi:hypothetical protein
VLGAGALAADGDLGSGLLLDPHLVAVGEHQGPHQLGVHGWPAFDHVDLGQGLHGADADLVAGEDGGHDCFGPVAEGFGDELGGRDVAGEFLGLWEEVEARLDEERDVTGRQGIHVRYLSANA